MAKRRQSKRAVRKPSRRRAPKAERADVALVTRLQLAKVVGTHPRTIAKWLEEGLPVAVKGRGGKASLFALPECWQWVLQRELQARDAAAQGLSPQQERALLDRRRREELELKLRIRRGQLVEVSAVQAEYADLAATLKAKLRGIPDAIAEQATAAAAAGPASVKALLATRIDDALRELARGVHEVPTSDDEDDDCDAPPAAEPVEANE